MLTFLLLPSPLPPPSSPLPCPLAFSSILMSFSILCPDLHAVPSLRIKQIAPACNYRATTDSLISLYACTLNYRWHSGHHLHICGETGGVMQTQGRQGLAWAAKKEDLHPLEKRGMAMAAQWLSWSVSCSADFSRHSGAYFWGWAGLFSRVVHYREIMVYDFACVLSFLFDHFKISRGLHCALKKASCKEFWVCTQISFQNTMQLLWIFQSATFVFQSCICGFQSFVQSGCDGSGFRKCASILLTHTITGFNRSCKTLHATAWAMIWVSKMHNIQPIDHYVVAVHHNNLSHTTKLELKCMILNTHCQLLSSP